MTKLHPDCSAAQFMIKLLDDPLIDEQLKQSHIVMCPTCYYYNKQQLKEEETEHGREIHYNRSSIEPINNTRR